MSRILCLLLMIPVAAFAATGDVMMQDCPMMLPDTNLSVEDVEGGIAVDITTRPENVAELQRRIEKMIAKHNGGPERTVQTEPIDNGFRLTLTPKDPAKIEELRELVRKHAGMMKNHACPMMKAAGTETEDDHSNH